MNEIIATKLYDQLRVLQLYMNEYEKELCGEILKKEDYWNLFWAVENVKNALCENTLSNIAK